MILPRCEPVEARVEAVVIMVVTPLRNQMAGMEEGREQVFVLAFVTQATIEALHEAFLHRFVWCDVMPFDLAVLAEDAIQLPPVHLPSLTLHQDVQPSIAKAPSLGGQLFQAHPQVGVLLPGRLPTIHARVDPRERTGTPLPVSIPLYGPSFRQN